METEELIFQIRAIATGLETATKSATERLNGLGKAYSDADDKGKKAEKSTDSLKKSQKEQAKASKEQQQAQKNVNAEIGATAAIAAAASAAFYGMITSIKDGIADYNEYISSMRGLQSVAVGTGTSFSKLTRITKELTSDGLMTVSQASAAEKNLLMYGYSADQVADILERLKDSAAYNRQAHYSLGDAVKVTTEGIRMENSVLSDAAGVQKNIAKMYEEYAKQIGKSTDSLTQAEKAQAVYNGIMAETSMQVGNARQYAEEFAGTQAKLEAQQLRLNTAYGDAASSGLKPYIILLTNGIGALADFAENHRVIVAILTTMITVVTGLIALLGVKAALIKLVGFAAGTSAVQVTTLAGAFKALWASIGPVGWVIAGITLLVTVISGISAAAEKAKKEAEELRKEIESLSENNKGAASLVAEYEELSKKTIKTADDSQRMLDIRAELVKTYGFTASAIDNEGRLLAGNLGLMREQLEVSRELLLNKLQENQASEEVSYNNALQDQIDLLGKIPQLKENLKNPQAALEEQFQIDYEISDNVIQAYIEDLEKQLNDIDISLKTVPEEAQAAIQNILKMMVLTIQSEGKDVPEALQEEVLNVLQNSFLSEESYDEAKSAAQTMFDAYFTIDENVADSSIASIQEFRDKLIVALASSEGIDTEAAASTINNLLDTILGEETQQAAYERAGVLKQRILDGLASAEEIAEYDSLIDMLNAKLLEARDNATWRPAVDAINDLREVCIVTSDELREMAAAAKIANKTLKDAASDLRSVASSYEQVSDAIKEVANLKAAVKAIEAYNSATNKSAELAKDNADAKAYLADVYGVEEGAIDGMLPSIQEDIELKEALALADYAVGMQAALSAQAQISAMITAGTVMKVEGQKMIAVLQNIIDKMAELGTSSVTIGGETISASSTIPTVRRTGGGGGSRTNRALERELALIEHKKALDQLTTQQEINNLERALSKYARTTAEKRDLTEQLYALRKQKAQEDLEYQEAMDKLTLREKIKSLDRMIASYKEGTDARRELEQQRYKAVRELEKQEFDLKVYYGRLTLEEQEDYLKQLVSTYKEGVDARIELEKELYDVQQKIRDTNIEQLDRLNDGVITALQNRYDEQRDLEKERINESIEAWQEWGDEQISAIQEQISALDDLTKEEDRAEEERKKRRKIAALEQQLQYEQDEYNRRKLQEQLISAQDDLNNWLRKNERDDLKDALQDQISAIEDQVDAEQDALNDKLDATDAYYDELTKQQSLQAEAQKLLMNSTQQEIIELLQSFAPEYNATGQSFGEQFVDGFTSVVGNLTDWFDRFILSFKEQWEQISNVANAAADRFFTVSPIPVPAAQTGTTQGTGGSEQFVQIIQHFHKDAPDPIENRRQLEQLLIDMKNR